MSGSYIYPIQEDSLSMQMARRRCNLVFVQEGLPERSAHFVFHNTSPMVPEWNNAIIMNMDFIRRTFRKYFRENFKIDQNRPVGGEDGGWWLCGNFNF